MGEDVCRLCTKYEDTLINVFDNEQDGDLPSNVELCFGVKITQSDPITKKICKQCYFLLKTYSELRLSAKNNDVRLMREYEERRKQKEPVQEENVERRSPSVTQDKFMNLLKLTSVKTVPTKVQHRRYFRWHPSIVKIKMQNEGIIIPTHCRHANMSPFVYLRKIDVAEWKSRGFSKVGVETVNNKRTGKTELDLIPPRKVLKSSHSKIKRLPEPKLIPENNISQKSVTVPASIVKHSSTSVSPTKKLDFNLENSNKKTLPKTDKRKQPDVENQAKKIKLEENRLIKNSKEKESLNSNEQDCIQALPELKDQRKLDVLINLIDHDKSLETNLYDSENEENLLVEAQSEQKTFICQTCNKILDTSKLLKEHQKDHQTSSLRCQKCSKCFQIVEELIKHNIDIHTKENIEEERSELNIMLNISTESYAIDKDPTKVSLVSKPSMDSVDNNKLASEKDQNKTLISKKSTCLVKIPQNSITNSVPSQSDEKESINKDKDVLIKSTPVEEFIISSDDDDDDNDNDVKIISCTRNSVITKLSDQNAKHNLNINAQDDKILEEALKSIQGGNENEKTDLSFFKTALQSQIPQDTNTKNTACQLVTVNSSNSTNTEIKSGNKPSSVTVSDEDIYLKYVFTKIHNKKTSTTPDIHKMNMFDGFRKNKMWVLRNMDVLLNKLFIPVEYVPSKNVSVKFICTAERAPKLKNTNYRWSILNAIDIPKSTVYSNRVTAESRQDKTNMPPPLRPFIASNVQTSALNLQKPSNLNINNVNSGPQLTTTNQTIPMQQNANILLPRSIAQYNNEPTRNLDISQQNITVENSLPVQNGTVPITEQYFAKLLSNGVVELLPSDKSSLQKSANVSNVLVPLLPKSIENQLGEKNPFNNQSILANFSNGNNNQTQTSVQQNFAGQPANVRIQNFVSINLPVNKTNTLVTAAQSTQNYNAISLPSTSGLISATSSGPSTSNTISAKPFLRIKNIAELTDNPAKCTSDGYSLQDMYMQTFVKYLRNFPDRQVRNTSSGDEYLQIS